MPLTEILAKLFRWTSVVWGALRRPKIGVSDRHKTNNGSPMRIEAEKAERLVIVLGQVDDDEPKRTRGRTRR
jgi:hypothetical protein